MRVKDKKGNLLAIVKRFQDINQEREFLTENKYEMQFASFDLPSGINIKRHIHNIQKRTVHNTTEAIVVLEGEIKISLYSEDDRSFVSSIVLYKGDSILMLYGGHEIDVLNDSKLVEFKQGPYDEAIDKELF